MDEKDAKKALAATQKRLALLDKMLMAPSTTHPLWPTFLASSKAKSGH